MNEKRSLKLSDLERRVHMRQESEKRQAGRQRSESMSNAAKTVGRAVIRFAGRISNDQDASKTLWKG